MTDYLPIVYDTNAKTLSLSEDVKLSDYKDLNLEITQLNTLIKDLINSNYDVPPPPTKESYTKNLSMMIKKMHASAVASMRAKKFSEAAKQFTVALGLSTARFKFESFQGTITEVMINLAGRADANMMMGQWLDAYLDCDLMCTLAANVPENHLRKGICNVKLGNLQEAKSDYERGLCFGADHPRLLGELANVNKLIAEENGEL
ncbi:hypothetical protein CANARDRAFT_198811 [[Candida] arabinofermentans NRRL YB-2248]|uniref:Translocation protein SEC72 n=1 Tax=[Candida] arabinofermentans NRRL YB-2248 TaxID=983967 RepID=A0A1E4T171_9ASCO|nr:hypothetical protein CANARDRAFT_198811 [[Candida] arabinofermentans NRRL YB-2248]